MVGVGWVVKKKSVENGGGGGGGGTQSVYDLTNEPI